MKRSQQQRQLDSSGCSYRQPGLRAWQLLVLQSTTARQLLACLLFLVLLLLVLVSYWL
jgi:hypothetical protein